MTLNSVEVEPKLYLICYEVVMNTYSAILTYFPSFRNFEYILQTHYSSTFAGFILCHSFNVSVAPIKSKGRSRRHAQNYHCPPPILYCHYHFRLVIQKLLPRYSQNYSLRYLFQFLLTFFSA